MKRRTKLTIFIVLLLFIAATVTIVVKSQITQREISVTVVNNADINFDATHSWAFFGFARRVEIGTSEEFTWSPKLGERNMIGLENWREGMDIIIDFDVSERGKVSNPQVRYRQSVSYVTGEAEYTQLHRYLTAEVTVHVNWRNQVFITVSENPDGH